MVLRNAKMLAGIDLVVKGDGPEEKADSLLASLIDHGLAEIIEDDAPVRISVPAAVWQGIDAVRHKSGQFLLTGSQNLLLMEKVTESLTGRAAMLGLLPLSRREAEGRPRISLPWESRRRPSSEKPFT